MPITHRPSSSPAAPPVPTPVALMKARLDGAKLIAPLQVEVAQIGTIQTEEAYLQADFLVARVNAAIAQWDLEIKPVLEPLQRVLDEAKLAMEGAKTLDKHVRGPLTTLLTDTKTAMKQFKLRELQQAADAKRLADQAAAGLRQRALAAATAAAVAKTPQAKAWLEHQQATLQAEAASVVEQALIESAPVKGAASSDRRVKKLRITKPLAFFTAMQDYAPQAGLYTMGHPPLTLLTHKMNRIGMLTEKDSALDTILIELHKIYSAQPGVVLSWPGVEEYDDIIIAAR